jgi:NAD(P)-dependent dehydrogenase (short-subunit alcohol dehydrogenase family)
MALELARAGADVAVNCLRSVAQAEGVVREVRALGRRSLAAPGDTREPADVDRIAGQVEAGLGSITILVNNAAYALQKPLLEITPEEWVSQLHYKGLAYYLTARRVLPGMIARRKGVIINLLSTVGLRGGHGESAYAAANGAAMALTRAIANEHGRDGIRCCGVMLTCAENGVDVNDPTVQPFLQNFALGRLTSMVEVARTVAFLASEAASGITGTLVAVDAGYLSV